MTHRRLRLLVALAALMVVRASVAHGEDSECPRWREAFATMPIKMLTLQTGTKTVAVRVKSADNAESQAGGFQCATPQEIQRNLILFDFGEEVATQFHMRNVPAPLDIAFIKADGRIFSIIKMATSQTQLYGPMGSFRYALEARAGFYESQGIRQGESRLVLPDGR